jgi:hypothetical protein
MAMSPAEQTRMKELERKVQALESVTNTAFVAELVRRIGGFQLVIEEGQGTGGINDVARNATDTGSVPVAADYSNSLNLYRNGVLIGKIGYY